LVEIVPAVAKKVDVVEPLDTVTDAGMASAPTLLDSATAAPPDPAAFDSVTIQVDAAPELRLVGEQANDIRAGGADSNVRDCV
jgi:hypothetical protein